MEDLLKTPVSSWPHLPWDQHNDYQPEKALHVLRTHLEGRRHGPETFEHHLESTLDFVFYSNQAEGIDHEFCATRLMLQQAMDEENGAIPGHGLQQRRQAAQGDAEHRRNLRFVVQHYQALRQVRGMKVSDFTVPSLNSIHHTLLEGLEDVDGDTTVTPGQLRTEARCATGISSRPVQYLMHDQIPSQYEDLVTLVRCRMKETVPAQDLAGGLALAGFFLVKFLEIHPYGDGNGRIARLLVHAILRLHGITNPLVLVRGRFRRARRHYLQMLDRIQHRAESPTMAFTFLLSHAYDNACMEAAAADRGVQRGGEVEGKGT